MAGMIYLVCYIASVVAANVITASTTPLSVTIGNTLFIVTWGTWFIGATFFLRDAVQVRYGRATAYKAIAVALAFSLVFSIWNGDVFWIVVASALAFGFSEALDTEVFTRYHSTLARRVFVSGVFGGFLDSALFVIVGLSPLTTGFVPWSAVPAAILGQWVVKSLLQALAAGGVRVSARHSVTDAGT